MSMSIFSVASCPMPKMKWNGIVYMRTIKQHTHISHADGLEFYLFALHLLLLSYVFFSSCMRHIHFVHIETQPWPLATESIGSAIKKEKIRTIGLKHNQFRHCSKLPYGFWTQCNASVHIFDANNVNIYITFAGRCCIVSADAGKMDGCENWQRI